MVRAVSNFKYFDFFFFECLNTLIFAMAETKQTKVVRLEVFNGDTVFSTIFSLFWLCNQLCKTSPLVGECLKPSNNFLGKSRG